MFYFYNKYLSDFWLMISQMVDGAYADESYSKSAMLLGSYVHRSVEDQKKEIFSANPDFDKIVVYQLEPLVDGHHWKTERLIENLRGADEVWDYDLQNIELLRKYGIDAKFRPPTSVQSLRKINSVDSPDIDLLFYGSYTPHRAEYIQNLYNASMPADLSDLYLRMNFVWLCGICDDKLDEYIARSKIILNLNPTAEESRQQQTRIFYPLINNKCVVSEKAPINYFGESIVEFNSPQDLAEKVVSLLSNDNWKQKTLNYNKHFTNVNTSSKKAIFYHLYQTGDWENIFTEQIVRLQQKGLFDEADYIHIGINGNKPLPYTFGKVNRIKYNENTDLEADTLSDMQSFCLANPDYKVMYIHAKGVTWSGGIDDIKSNIKSWRDYLEYFTIDQWERCCNLLDTHDCVGTEWEDDAYINNESITAPHYAGNFWWANASYINKLNLDYLYDRNAWTRWKGEFWLGTETPNYYNFYNSGKNKYYMNIDRSEYEKY